MNSYLMYSKNLFIKESRPLSLVYFITNRCNLRCSHCFFLEEINKKSEELSLEEINLLSKSIGRFLSLSLTGGEPFLREDISEIAKIFYKNSSVRNLNIPTNGILLEKIIANTKKILNDCPDLALNLAISIDGLSETHDKMRNRKGAFSQAVETFKAVKDLKRYHKNLSLEIISVISAGNQGQLNELYDYVIDELKPDSVNLSPIRGSVKDVSLKNFDVMLYDKIIKRLQRDFLKQRISGYANFAFSEYVFALRMIRPRIVSRILKKGCYQTRCYAGMLSGVIYANGDVYPCELLDTKIGNLRDYNLDFMKLWRSQEAEKVRRQIKQSKCFCIHPCNFTVNILFNLKYVPYLLGYGFWLKWMRLLKKAGLAR